MSDQPEPTDKPAIDDAATPPSFIDAKRRGFLQGAVLAGGAAASGASLAGGVSDTAVESDIVKPATSGYRETDHVRDYYAAARF